MNQTTVGRVLGWLAEATGKDARQDRPHLIDMLNDIRQLAYANQQILEHAKPAYICVPVRSFCGTCEPGYCGYISGRAYRGITLPNWMLQATAIFQGGIALPYVTRWTAYAPSPGTHAEPLKFEDMGDAFVLEQDPECTTPFKLELMATRCSPGQKVTLTYLDEFNNRQTKDVLLKAGSWVALETKVSSILPAAVRLPLDLEGPIKVRADGVDVAQWEPGIDVPAFRRIKIPRCGRGNTIAVKGIRRFTRLWDDHDIVEHDNRMAWRAGANFRMSTDNAKMDQAEIANAMFKRNLFDGFIASEADAEDTGHRRRLRIATTFNNPNPFGM